MEPLEFNDFNDFNGSFGGNNEHMFDCTFNDIEIIKNQITDDSNLVDFGQIDKTPNFRDFLEENLGSIIRCPIAQCVVGTPVVASDGFVYESTSLKQLTKLSHYSYFKSPITREKMDKDFIKIPLIIKLIEYADKYKLEVSKEKYLVEESYEDIFDDICTIFRNGNYEEIYGINKFKLDYIGMGSNTSLCQTVLTAQSHDNTGFLNALAYVFDNVESIHININGMNILHFLCRFSIFTQLIIHVIEQLEIKYKLDINSFNTQDNYHKTPVDYLFDRGHPTLIELALTCGMQISGQLNKYIHTAIQTCNDSQTVINLIDKLENNNEFNGMNMSPLFTAIKYKRHDIINHLITKVNVEQPNNNNINAIHYALQYGDPNIAIQLLDKCTDLEAEAYDGWRLIHMACYYCQKVVIDQLLDKDVRVNVQINKFQGKDVAYLPINLIEISQKINDHDKDQLIEYILQLMAIQSMEAS